jgi:molybdopterin/thiamine biosynthesis adenylyltransferase
MANRLVLAKDMWDRIRAHLLADDAEHLCFILAEHAEVEGSHLLLGRELVITEDSELEEGGRFGLSLRLEALIRVMNRANELACVLIEAHSHPFSRDAVDFSYLDMDGQAEMVAHLSDVLPGRAYGAIVLGQSAVRGHIWLPGEANSAPLHAIRVVGPVVTVLSANRTSSDSLPTGGDAAVEDTYHRQALALGDDGHRKLEQATVGIVGLGGLGSAVAQQLAYLGVGAFLLIDDDRVERTNLNRLVGATREVVGRQKAEVASEHIRRINPAASVDALNANVRSVEVLGRLSACDVVFGCVDTDSARLILNELANAYLIPYIDCGVGIDVEDGRIEDAGGRVIVWVPGRPCLLCAREIDTRIAAEELESAEQREFRKRHGYVSGASIPEPAIISLNGLIASVAVTEFLALITGMRETRHYTFYDMLEQRLVPRIVPVDTRCVACCLAGLGGKAHLARYAGPALPADLPA